MRYYSIPILYFETAIISGPVGCSPPLQYSLIIKIKNLNVWMTWPDIFFIFLSSSTTTSLPPSQALFIFGTTFCYSRHYDCFCFSSAHNSCIVLTATTATTTTTRFSTPTPTAEKFTQFVVHGIDVKQDSMKSNADCRHKNRDPFVDRLSFFFW